MAFQDALSIRQQFATDFHRPIYHFQPPSNWMNDPNGAIQWQGTYHLFYQYNPHGPLWGDIHWGHAASPDLIHWTDWPVALAPTPGGPDETGCFSGCAVDDNGVPTLIYTGVRGEHYEVQTQCVAGSHDGLRTFQKFAGNPVISQLPPEAVQKRDFRDPYVWKEGDSWYMVLGSRIEDVGGAIFLYRSHNLHDWEYLHPLLVNDPATGEYNVSSSIWECPNFFKLGDKWVLIISYHTGHQTATVIYFVGTFENLRFTPEYQGVFDHGQLYAPLSFLDAQNRRILHGWLREDRSDRAQRAAGWSGAQSIPRVLTLDAQNRLNSAPVPDVERLRGQQHHDGPSPLTEDRTLDFAGLNFDLVARFQPEANGRCGLSVGYSPETNESLDIVFDAARQLFIVRKVHFEADGARVTHEREIPHVLDPGEVLTLRVLADGSVVELIANGRTSITSRIYPAQAGHNHVRLLGDHAQLIALDIWEMSSIW